MKRLILILLCTLSALAVEWERTDKIVASDRTRGSDEFGFAVAVEGATAIIATESGDAYLFERSPMGKWNESLRVVKVRARAVAAGATDVVVGGHKGGAVLSLRDGGWHVAARFAHKADAVAISGGDAVIGDTTERYGLDGDARASHGGAVYVLKKRSDGRWVEAQKLVARDRQEYDAFGQSVAISGDTIFIGAYEEDHDARGFNEEPETGSVYVFARQADGRWQQTQKLVASDRESLENFGYCVDVSGDHAVVGARFGRVYFFDRNATGQWVEVDKKGEDEVKSAAISGNYVFVGYERRIQIYRRIEKLWIPMQSLESKYGIGPSVDVSGEVAIVGNPREDFDAEEIREISNAGAAYLYALTQ